MGRRLSLKLTLKRAVLVTAANWPTVAIQFVAQFTFTLLLLVPTAAGVSLAGLVLDTPNDLARREFREIVLAVVSGLEGQPLALAAFVLGLLVVVIGGSGLTFVAKAGTMAVLVDGDRYAGHIERPPLRWHTFRRAARFSAESFLEGTRRFGRRYVALGCLLLGVYGLSGAAYLVAALEGRRWLDIAGAPLGLTVIVGLTSVLVVWITLVNLMYALMQIAVVAADVGIVGAGRRVIALLYHRGSDVILIFVLTALVALVALTATVLATAALGLIAFVPFFGLAVIPLQLVAWMIRGLVLQFVGLASIVAYLTVFRAAAEGNVAPGQHELQQPA
jgi:hypothetical protein